MFPKAFILLLCLSFCLCYSYRKSSDDNGLKNEIQKYKTNDCLTDDSGEDIRTRGRRKFNRDRSRNFGLDFGKGHVDQYDSESTEEPEYHPNPFLYIGDRNVGFEGAFGDNMEGYIPQDMRNARKRNEKTFQNRYSYSRQGSLRSFNSNVGCVSQCVFNNMDIMEDDGIPSEALMMKWAQDQIKNDRKSHAAFKEIRKCFHSISNADKQNGCEFSKYLSKCLKLELEEDY